MKEATKVLLSLAGAALLLAGCNNLNQPKADRVAIAKVEWGQTLLLENPRLIGEKPALLRVHLVASPVPARLSEPLTGAVWAGDTFLGNLSFTCPGSIPTSTKQGDLNTTCNATLPASWVVPGLRVELRADPQGLLGGDPAEKSRTLTPRVESGPTLHLTVVPVVYQGAMPTIPTHRPRHLAPEGRGAHGQGPLHLLGKPQP